MRLALLSLHSTITVRNENSERIATTVGRIIFNEAVRDAISLNISLLG